MKSWLKLFSEDEYEQEVKHELEEDQYELEVKEELHEYPWVAGRIGKYKYCAKVFNESSDFGIDGGNISKLSVIDDRGKTVINYDRRWEVEPKYSYEKELLEEIMNRYEVDGDETEEYHRENGILRTFFGR